MTDATPTLPVLMHVYRGPRDQYAAGGHLEHGVLTVEGITWLGDVTVTDDPHQPHAVRSQHMTSNMTPIGIPPAAVRSNPNLRALHIGPPPGVLDEDCGTPEALVGQSDEGYDRLRTGGRLMRHQLRRARLYVAHVFNRYFGGYLPAKVIYIANEWDDDYELVPCWCGEEHPVEEWHDPTHGKVDRDIQDMVAKGFPGIDHAQAFAIMLTAQDRRDRGLSI